MMPHPIKLLPNDLVLLTFPCGSDFLIAMAYVCDGVQHCADNSDEVDCPNSRCHASLCSVYSNSTKLATLLRRSICPVHYMYCSSGSGHCVSHTSLCDEVRNCENGEDEYKCPAWRGAYKLSGIRYTQPTVQVENTSHLYAGFCDGNHSYIPCRSGQLCFPLSAICVYDHGASFAVASSVSSLLHCSDGTHLGDKGSCTCDYIGCSQHYKCHLAYCIPIRKLCNGVVDCPDADDEAFCDNYTCPEMLRCSNHLYCVPPWEVCDGVIDCQYSHDDELYCSPCPAGCDCLGLSLDCSAAQSDMVLANFSYAKNVILDNTTIFPYLYNRTKAEFWSSLHSISLSNCQVQEIIDQEVTLQFGSLLYMSISHNRLTILPSKVLYCCRLLLLDISHNHIHTVRKSSLQNVQNIEVLDLSHNRILALHVHYFNSLHKLTVLFLQDNPIRYIDPETFINSQLATVRSDWSMICCVIPHVSDCLPQRSFVSSCTNLLASVVHRHISIVQMIIILVLNTLVMVIRIQKQMPERVQFCHLAVADVMMSIYLAHLIIYDSSYRNRFNTVTSTWTASIGCHSAAVFHFVSSQMSLLLLTLTTILRSVTITYSKRYSARPLSISLWICTASVALTICLLSLKVETAIHSNMCIFFGVNGDYGITSTTLITHIVYVGMNTLCLLTLVTSNALIVVAVKKSRNAVQHSSKDSQLTGRTSLLFKLSIKIIVLLFAAMGTWLPALIAHILVLSGVRVTDQLLGWLVVSIMPFSGLANPIFYTFHAWLTTRKQSVGRPR